MEPTEFEAVIVKLNSSVFAGVPVTAPVVALSDNPVGKEPDVTEYVGVGFPTADTESEYATPTLGLARAESVYDGTEYVVADVMDDRNITPAVVVLIR